LQGPKQWHPAARYEQHTNADQHRPASYLDAATVAAQEAERALSSGEPDGGEHDRDAKANLSLLNDLHLHDA
jgi:hypothetical protein